MYCKKVLKKELKANVSDYFLKCGFITKKNEFASELFQKFIPEYNRVVSLRLDKSFILADGINISDEFSPSQKIVLKNIISEGRISRDEIKNIFSPQKPEEYSESAIDKSISRIRLKLGAIGISPSIIETDKKRGFVIKKK